MKAFVIILLSLLSTLASAELSLKKVDHKKVCMIQNTLFDAPQMEVKVGKSTYFACCKMCREKLTNDPKSRVAIDPLSGKEVDKSKAVIGALKDGSILYFENEKNLLKYSKTN